jgi:hypothetical protein
MERGWQYEHAALLLAGARVVESATGVANTIEKMRKEMMGHGGSQS